MIMENAPPWDWIRGKRRGGEELESPAKAKEIRGERVLVSDDGLPIMNDSIADSDFSRRKGARRNVGERDGVEVGMKKSGLETERGKEGKRKFSGRRTSKVEELVV